MTETVTISTLEHRLTTNGKDYWLIVDSKNRRLTCWDKEIVQIPPGGSVTGTVEQKGNYLTLRDWQPVPPAKPPEPAPLAAIDPRNSSIESQVAFKGIVDLLANDKITADSRAAKLAIAWAEKRLG